MNVDFITPSTTEATVQDSPRPGVHMRIKPLRWDTKQQSLTVGPVEVRSESGKVLDSALLIVNQRTGKLMLSRISPDPLPCEADQGGDT